jgi:tetratricopeptide (TPR) repeat protein
MLSSRTQRLFGALIAGTGALLASAVAFGANREWLMDFPAALAKAKAEDRFIVAYFALASSPSCQKMESQTLALSPTVKALEGFVRVRVDVERDRGWALQYRIKQCPAVVFFDSQGRELDRFSGFCDFRTLLRRALEAVDSKTNYVLLKERLGADPGDVEALYYMGFKYVRRDDFDRAAKYFEKVKRLDKDDERGFFDNIELHELQMLPQRGELEEALRRTADFGARHPESDVLDQADLLRARLLWMTGQGAQALEAYERFLLEHPDSQLRPRAQEALAGLRAVPPPGSPEGERP